MDHTILRAYNNCKYSEGREKEMTDGIDVSEAIEKQKPKKPIIKHYEDEGEEPYIKYACPNDCGIQLHPVTEKNLAYEHVYCPKCGQKIDWQGIGGNKRLNN